MLFSCIRMFILPGLLLPVWTIYEKTHSAEKKRKTFKVPAKQNDVEFFFSKLNKQWARHHMYEQLCMVCDPSWMDVHRWWLITCSFNWNSHCHSLYHVSSCCAAQFYRMHIEIKDGWIDSHEGRLYYMVCYVRVHCRSISCIYK